MTTHPILHRPPSQNCPPHPLYASLQFMKRYCCPSIHPFAQRLQVLSSTPLHTAQYGLEAMLGPSHVRLQPPYHLVQACVEAALHISSKTEFLFNIKNNKLTILIIDNGINN